ncbi:uncharacterized protein TRIVIDRAFT_152685 [Trichoderma virens Gv29-8]|uniref:Uncharacterized protein n=1 Tax=Hypocrea virens (strain Gv29-8 / FGSC 10586) TaxID=413071 RepID=G9MW03_HYPVG|nr:uncharacterized protein TRIVIDRAFT_152685 [Trichoderma virens Gv29-8]EHK21299.1 hypothetical protein TRIVIDRAFT_152685 [Trichoderma virens Gv29-8]
MPRGVAKQSQQSPTIKKSSKNRKAAVLVIKTIGFLVMPYSYCKTNKLPYKMAPGYKRYKECMRRSRTYDRNGISLANTQRLATEKERIDAKEHQTEQKLL